MTNCDKRRLCGLASTYAELAASDANRACVALWKRHHAFKAEQPLVRVEIDTFESELIDPLLTCEDAAARRLEAELLRGFVNQQLLGDDTPIPAYFPVRRMNWFHPFGHETKRVLSGEGGASVGHRFEHVIEDLEEDYERLGACAFGADMQAENEHLLLAQETFGDILPARLQMGCHYAVPTQCMVHLMGMESLYYAINDCPELLKETMDRLAHGYIAWFQRMQQAGLLLPTAEFEPLGQGSFCFTDELPDEAALTTNSLWGFMDSQETVGVSPDTFGEFFFPAYEKIARYFGLTSYGCCEPLNPVWKYVSTLHNLRKVSVSPWANELFMGEQLRGQNIVYHRKPSPNFLGVGDALDEAALRAHIHQTLSAARGCALEITQRDVYTINRDVAKARRFVDLIRECIDERWGAGGELRMKTILAYDGIMQMQRRFAHVGN